MTQADAVFSARVTSLQKVLRKFEVEKGEWIERELFEAQVKVSKTFKGKVAELSKVLTGLGDGDCGFSFREGEEYLIYAHGKNDVWHTNICARTALMKDAVWEILELEGRLPIPKTPAREPSIEVRGSIDDAGYKGFVFVLRNRLHERIFYLTEREMFVQVLQDGQWRDYPIANGIQPSEDWKAEDVAEMLELQRRDYASLPTENHLQALDRMSGTSLFAVNQTGKFKWRIGIQYLTEKELDAGAKLQDSKHYVWSEPIDAAQKFKLLTFEEAFVREPQSE